jgi:hypothetical protein
MKTQCYDVVNILPCAAIIGDRRQSANVEMMGQGFRNDTTMWAAEGKKLQCVFTWHAKPCGPKVSSNLWPNNVIENPHIGFLKNNQIEGNTKHKDSPCWELRDGLKIYWSCATVGCLPLGKFISWRAWSLTYHKGTDTMAKSSINVTCCKLIELQSPELRYLTPRFWNWNMYWDAGIFGFQPWQMSTKYHDFAGMQLTDVKMCVLINRIKMQWVSIELHGLSD